MENLSSDLLAKLTISFAILSILSLLILHILSKEFKPSWRMISEYAMGNHKWLITSFFICWGLSTFSLSLLLWGMVDNLWFKIGVVLLFISGAGEIMGGIFDVKHKHHGLAFLFGVPTLPAAALIISYQLGHVEGWILYQMPMIYSAHATWISLILMAAAMMIMFAGFKKAGVAVGPDEPAPERIPKGVIAVGGYANRLLVLCYLHWLVMIATSYLQL